MIDTDMCHREPVSVRVEELIRAFEDLVAVDHLNFDIPAGRMTGFVGANGAGKTTTMRMIVGVLKPTSGQVLWSGRPITTEDRRTIGYMPEERGLYPKQPVIDQLVYLARIKGASAQTARTEAMEYLDRFGFADHAREQVQKLSLGNQQRIQVKRHRCLLIRQSSFSMSPSPDSIRWPWTRWPMYCARSVPGVIGWRPVAILAGCARCPA